MLSSEDPPTRPVFEDLRGEGTLKNKMEYKYAARDSHQRLTQHFF